MPGLSNGSSPDWVARLGLEPHPEGGWFRRIYTAERRVGTGPEARRCASSIQYLLTAAQPLGRLHRNRSDILHLLQDGGPVEYLVHDERHRPALHRLGYADGEAVSLLVPGGVWKGSRLVDGADHALVAELVVPGFDWQDHRFADPGWLACQPEAIRGLLAAFVAQT